MTTITFDIIHDHFPKLHKSLKEYAGHCVAYILWNDREVYIGETSHLVNRFASHARSKAPHDFRRSYIVSSKYFNKSAVYDIETRLIEHVFADRKFKVVNKRLRQDSHVYYMKEEINNQLFTQLWERMRKDGMAERSLQEIENSVTFKYSPFKQFSAQQISVAEQIIERISRPTYIEIPSFEGRCLQREIIPDRVARFLVEGGAGTGKTLLIVKLLYDLQVLYRVPTKNMAVCVPQASLKSTLKALFREMRLDAKVIRPIDLSKKPEEKYDLLIVDEAHRLKKFFSKQAKDLSHLAGGVTEFDLALRKSDKLVLMYDEKQSIRPADVAPDEMDLDGFERFTLDQQFRVRKGVDYLRFLRALLQIDECEPRREDIGEYELRMVGSIRALHSTIREKDKLVGLSRLCAGYSRKWLSRKDPEAWDFVEEDYRLRWNSRLDGWVLSENAVNEVGCVHTLQGQDLNYAGVIIGKDIYLDETDGRVKIRKSEYFDRNGTPLKGSDEDDAELTRFIKNIYYVLLSRGILGTYIYVEDPALRRYIGKFLPGDE